MKIKTSKIENIHEDLRSKLANVCFEERCWIKQLYTGNSQKIIDKYFAPAQPKTWEKNKNTWLNSLDISR